MSSKSRLSCPIRLFRNAFEAGGAFPASVAAIGKFEAMHRGHRAVIRTARREADRRKTSCLVVTFDPSPEQFLGLSRGRPLLTANERLAILKRWGVDAAVLLPFNRQLACISPDAFARNVLALQLRPAAVCVGSDFCFGKDRAGRVETLKELGAELGFAVRSVPLLRTAGEKISSSYIRGLLERGQRAKAARLLGWDPAAVTRAGRARSRA